jgi:hypothetical protein
MSVLRRVFGLLLLVPGVLFLLAGTGLVLFAVAVLEEERPDPPYVRIPELLRRKVKS